MVGILSLLLSTYLFPAYFIISPWRNDGDVVSTTGKATRLTRVSGGAEESGFKKFVKIYAEEFKETFRRR